MGYNDQTFQVKSVRNVFVNNHLFGADIAIQAYAGKAMAYSISKKKAQKMKDLLLNQEWAKSGGVDISIGTEEVSLD